MRAATVLIAVALAGCISRAGASPSDRPSSLTPSPATALATRSAIPSSPATPTPTSDVAPSAGATARDLQLVRDLIAFARTPTAASFGALPLADRVGIGLAEKIVTTRPAAELAQPSAWVMTPALPFRAYIGAQSALALLRNSGGTVVRVGPHEHCASPPVPAPVGFADHRRVSVQPTGIDTCLRWWTVDLFMASGGRIEAVTLDLWEP